MSTFKLSKAAHINGQEVTEIEYDLERLTTDDIDNANLELKKLGQQVAVQELDQKLLSILFAYSAGLGPNDLKVLNAKDYIKVSGIVRNFLLDVSEE